MHFLSNFPTFKLKKHLKKYDDLMLKRRKQNGAFKHPSHVETKKRTENAVAHWGN